MTKPIAKLCRSTLSLATLTIWSAASWLTAGCGAVAHADDEAAAADELVEGPTADEALVSTGQQAIKVTRPTLPKQPVRKLEPAVALTVAECTQLNGTIATDGASQCPTTISEVGGIRLRGKFRCATAGGGSACIDESAKGP